MNLQQATSFLALMAVGASAWVIRPGSYSPFSRLPWSDRRSLLLQSTAVALEPDTSMTTTSPWIPTPTPWDETAAQELLDDLVDLQEETIVGELLQDCLKAIEDPVEYRGSYKDRGDFWKPYVDGELTMRHFFDLWVRYSPVPTAQKGVVPDSPGYYITMWDYLANTEPGLVLTNEVQPFKEWFTRFLDVHGRWINSPESTGTLDQWLKYNGTTQHPFDINDYVIPEKGFQSFNQFFLRNLKNPAKERPVQGYTDPGVINSPNDGGTFFLRNGAELPGKSGDCYDVQDAFPEHGEKFVNGTLLDSLLWFTDYHHFCAPVNGTVIFMGEYDGSYNYDFDNYDPTDPYHPAPPTDDSDRVGWYKQLPKHKRFNWVIDTHDEAIGYVGMSAIGFWGVNGINNTVPDIGQKVVKGEPMGNFNYGGSSIVLAFEPRANNIKWKTGNENATLADADYPTLVKVSEQIGTL